MRYLVWLLEATVLQNRTLSSLIAGKLPSSFQFSNHLAQVGRLAMAKATLWMKVRQ